MNLDQLRSNALGLKGTTEDSPFGPEVLVFRVMGKIYALVSLEAVPLRVNLKCDPERAVELRDRYDSVLPGYHMNKKHWNTVILDGTVPVREFDEMIRHAYELIVAGLTRRQRSELESIKS